MSWSCPWLDIGKLPNIIQQDFADPFLLLLCQIPRPSPGRSLFTPIPIGIALAFLQDPVDGLQAWALAILFLAFLIALLPLHTSLPHADNATLGQRVQTNKRFFAIFETSKSKGPTNGNETLLNNSKVSKTAKVIRCIPWYMSRLSLCFHLYLNAPSQFSTNRVFQHTCNPHQTCS